jgi:hypothetical protein
MMMMWIQNTNVSECVRILRGEGRDIIGPRTDSLAIELTDSIAELKDCYSSEQVILGCGISKLIG